MRSGRGYDVAWIIYAWLCKIFSGCDEPRWLFSNAANDEE